jgi:hypothetical protein
VLAFAFRVYRIDELPGPIYSDEAQNGVDALAVVEGWRPIFFPANNGREPLHIYIEALSVALFGPTDFALRIVNVLAGTATVVVVALLGRALAGWRVGLLAGTWLAVSYWHISLSRLSFRVIQLPLWTALAVLFFVLALRSPHRRAHWLAALGGVALGLSLYTYTSARLFPLAFGAVALVAWLAYRPPVRQFATLVAATSIVALVVVAPLGTYFARHPEQALMRASQVRLGGDDDPRVTHDQLRPRGLLENTAVTLGALGFAGDRNVRHNLPGRPIFDFVTFAFLCVGTWLAARGTHRWLVAVCLAWLVVMVAPSAASVEAPHYLRLAGIIPPVFVLAGLAADAVIRAGRGWAMAAVGALLVFGGVDSARAYFVDYRHEPTRAVQFDSHVHAAVDRARDLSARGIPTWSASPQQHPLFLYALRRHQQPIEHFTELPPALVAARSRGGAIAIEAFGHSVPDVNDVLLLSSRPVPAAGPRPLLDGALRLDGWEIVGGREDAERPGGRRLEAWLYWQAAEPLGRRYDGALVARDGAGAVVSVGQDPWASSLWPSTLWHPGERYAMRTDLRLPATVDRSRPLRLSVELTEVPRQPGSPAVLETVDLGEVPLP